MEAFSLSLLDMQRENMLQVRLKTQSKRMKNVRQQQFLCCKHHSAVLPGARKDAFSGQNNFYSAPATCQTLPGAARHCLIYSSFYLLNFIEKKPKLIRLKQSIKTKPNTPAAHLFVDLVFQSIDVAFLQKALCFLQLVLH